MKCTRSKLATVSMPIIMVIALFMTIISAVVILNVTECKGVLVQKNPVHSDNSGQANKITGYSPIEITIDGPSVLATSSSTGETAMYKLYIQGGPASIANKSQEVNWSYDAYLLGDYANAGNKSLPLLSSPAMGHSNETGNFTFNVTAPIVECSITLYVNASSAIVDNTTATAQRSMTIQVVKPVILRAFVHNYGSININNIEVHFYVDDVPIGIKNIVTLNSNNSANVTMNWTVSSYSVGYHTAKIDITGGGPMILFTNGQNIITYDFYINSLQPDQWEKVWYGLGILLLIIVIVIFILVYLSSGKPPVQPVKKL